MPPAFRSAAGSNNAAGGATITMTAPAGVVDNDTLVMAIDVRGGSGTTVTPAPAWTSRTSGLSGSDQIFQLRSNGSLFVLCARGATSGKHLSTSPDGITWTSRTVTGTTWAIYDAAFGASTWVAVGAAGTPSSTTLYTSPDGVTWTSRTNPLGSEAEQSAICFGNGLFLLVGRNGSIYTSPDGITWTVQTGAFADFGQVATVAASSSLFVIAQGAGKIQTSPDGVTWTQQFSPFKVADSIWGIVLGGSTWLIGGGTGGKLARSTDGTTWALVTPRPMSPSAGGIPGLGWDGTRFVAVTSGSLTVYYSTDGITWLTGSTLSAQAVVAFGSSTWVAASWFGTGVSTATSLTDWLQILSTDSTTTIGKRTFWKIAANEPASYSVTLTSNKASGTIVAISGGDTVSAPSGGEVAGQANVSAVACVAPALGSFTAALGVDLYFAGWAIGGDVLTGITPGSYTNRASSQSTGGSTSTRTQSVAATRDFSTPQTTVGSLTASDTSAAINIGHHVYVTDLATRKPPGKPPKPGTGGIDAGAGAVRMVNQAMNRSVSF